VLQFPYRAVWVQDRHALQNGFSCTLEINEDGAAAFIADMASADISGEVEHIAEKYLSSNPAGPKAL
jgi:hypothetical protein